MGQCNKQKIHIIYRYIYYYSRNPTFALITAFLTLGMFSTSFTMESAELVHTSLGCSKTFHLVKLFEKMPRVDTAANEANGSYFEEPKYKVI